MLRNKLLLLATFALVFVVLGCLFVEWFGWFGHNWYYYTAVMGLLYAVEARAEQEA